MDKLVLSSINGNKSELPKLYGQVPGGQAEYLRVPQAQDGPIKVPEGPPDEQFVYMSDVLTAWQAVEYASVPESGSVVVFGLGPIGQMSANIAKHRGYRVIARSRSIWCRNVCR